MGENFGNSDQCAFPGEGEMYQSCGTRGSETAMTSRGTAGCYRRSSWGSSFRPGTSGGGGAGGSKGEELTGLKGGAKETSSVRGTQTDGLGGRLWENPHLLLHVPTESQICPTLVLQCVFLPNRQSPLTEDFFPLILSRLMLHHGEGFRASAQTAALLRCLLNIINQLSFFINCYFFSACCSKII